MMWLFLLYFSCSETSSEPQNEEIVAEMIEKKTERGPIQAKLVLSPKSPKVGDRITLALTVEAGDNIEVDMPPFGEALGRFQIVEFKPSKPKNGSHLYSQEYILQAPMSGVQTIPALRVVFRDLRTDPQAEEQELLTEELSVDIVSMVPEDAPLDFFPARGDLQPKIDIPIWVWIVSSTGILLFSSWFGFRWFKSWQAKEIVRTAYEKALDALLELERKTEIPIDSYYAELSFILRRYIEARFSVPVLEKTTPEFLVVAEQSGVFLPEQLAFLGGFLQRSDDVKYAQQQPEIGEGDTEMSLIRRFLEATRVKEEQV